ncbi:Lrp/AsnC family transcriptional regulator [Paracoccus methylovorus]|uniref:Lrp/AsnC family transcriptional regulator n=3 Tax=Paracoccus TaxID=265 RepID=A0ABX7JP26_9RHOB|nr:Lrp/AsnC family transcriptional regulator [Paracoccus methylovorus]
MASSETARINDTDYSSGGIEGCCGSCWQISRATVRAHLEKLRSEGEIAGFTVLTRSDVSDAPVRGLMMIGIEGRGGDRIAGRVTGITAVTAVHSTNGKWDMIVELSTDTLADLDEVIRRIRNLDGVMISETNLILSTRRASGSPTRPVRGF